MTNKQNSILILMLFSIIFLSLEKIKLSFEINRLNNNQENLIKEHESFKDKNIKLITQSYANNSPPKLNFFFCIISLTYLSPTFARINFIPLMLKNFSKP